MELVMIVFLLRHADRPLTPPGGAPPDELTEAGRQRARLLARMLAESNVRVAYRSEFARTAQTLGPLEHTLGDALTVHEIKIKPPDGGLDQHIGRIVAAIRALDDDAVAVVVSHDTTVGPIMQGLGGTNVAITEHEFDRLFVLFIPADGPVSQLNLRYGP
jgi:phosphohistidine phosphatase SixA